MLFYSPWAFRTIVFIYLVFNEAVSSAGYGALSPPRP